MTEIRLMDELAEFMDGIVRGIIVGIGIVCMGAIVAGLVILLMEVVCL